jgi:MFS family permease
VSEAPLVPARVPRAALHSIRKASMMRLRMGEEDRPTLSRYAPGARKALALLLLLNLFNYIDRSVLPAVEVQIAHQFGATKAQMGWLATGFLLVYMLTAPAFGWLADRKSRWALVGIGIVIQALASGGSGIASTYWMLLIMRCLVGVGDAAYGPAAPTLIADLFPIEVRARKLAWFYAAIPVGSAMGYGIGGAMLHATGNWRWGFYVLVAPMIVLGLLCFLMKDPRPRGATATPHHKLAARDYLAMLRNRSYVLNCLGMSAMTFAIGGIAFWMPRYLEVTRGLSNFAANLGFSIVVVVTGLFATLAGGYVGDRLRPRMAGAYFIVSGISMLVGFPLVLLMLITPFPACWAVIGAAVFCLFFNTGPTNTIIANVMPPQLRASAFAVNIFVVHALGDAISPPIIGAIADRSSLNWGFAMVSVVILLSGVLWLAGARHLAADESAAIK